MRTFSRSCISPSLIPPQHAATSKLSALLARNELEGDLHDGTVVIP